MVLLYSFLGLAFYTLWRDLHQQGQLMVARQPIPLTLTSTAETNLGSKHFAKPVIILGREPGCEFHLDDQTVSLKHARLSYRQNQWWLEDMASTNGTFLNGEAITAPVVITHGDELRLGQVEVRIAIGDCDPSDLGLVNS
jgi:predicted component of type VI protein secretion system